MSRSDGSLGIGRATPASLRLRLVYQSGPGRQFVLSESTRRPLPDSNDTVVCGVVAKRSESMGDSCSRRDVAPTGGSSSTPHMPQLSASASSHCTDADVVVVGAGPAGSTAAAGLARRGHRVMLLEAAAFPRDKVCGDVLLPEMERSLASIGTSLDHLAPDAFVVRGCGFTPPHARRVTGEFRDANGTTYPWRILPRKIFDERLARHAQRCGAVLLEQHRLERMSWDRVAQVNTLDVRHVGGTVTYRAPLVIGADGAFSCVRRLRGLDHIAGHRRRRYSVTLRTYADWPDPEPLFEVVTDDTWPRGCCWIVPIPGGRANVGIGTFDVPTRPTRAVLTARLQQVLGSRVVLDTPATLAGWHLPSPSLWRRAVADGLLLAGDAAGFVDPFTGHGIHNAVRSGVLAAIAVDRALATGSYLGTDSALRGYQRAWRQSFAIDFTLGRVLQRVHGDLRLLDSVMSRAARDADFADRVIGLIGHAGSRTQALHPGFIWDVIRSRIAGTSEASDPSRRTA